MTFSKIDNLTFLKNVILSFFYFFSWLDLFLAYSLTLELNFLQHPKHQYTNKKDRI
jgi:hypothetical protein